MAKIRIKIETNSEQINGKTLLNKTAWGHRQSQQTETQTVGSPKMSTIIIQQANYQVPITGGTSKEGGCTEDLWVYPRGGRRGVKEREGTKITASINIAAGRKS